MFTQEEFSQIRAFAQKAWPGPYLSQNEAGGRHTLSISRTTPEGIVLMRALWCTIGKNELEVRQASFWASLWPERVIAIMDEIEQTNQKSAQQGNALKNEELDQIRAFALKAWPGPYVAHDDRHWHTPSVGRITAGDVSLMRGLNCVDVDYEREKNQTDFWAALWPDRIIAMIDKIKELRSQQLMTHQSE